VSEPSGDGDPLRSGDTLAANDHLHGALKAALTKA